MFSFFKRLFARKARHVEVHVHTPVEERHFEVVPVLHSLSTESKAKSAASNTPSKAPVKRSYPAKPKSASRKKSNAKKSPSRKKKSK